jgi:hypothetical protein
MSAKTDQVVELRLAINAEKYLLLYKGVARQILATSVDGRRIRFPAKILQPYVTRDGVYGRFAIRFSCEGRFVNIRRLQ